ncbi:MAG: hypothetical protein M3277_09245 [Actinomycetota bacterium]|nr:hypothetical protein [Actinomycetota bacterium]
MIRAVLTLAPDGQTAAAVHSAVSVLQERLPVRHLGLVPDYWYGGGAAGGFARQGVPSVTLPRPSGDRRPWWEASDPEAELDDALPSILSVLDDTARPFSPLLVVVDDRGPLEVALIRHAESSAIPVVLVQHGPNVPLAFRRSGVRAATRRVASPQDTLRAMRRRLVANTPKNLPAVLPAGHNGSYPICTYSGHAHDLLRASGVSVGRLRPTGYPGFDRLLSMNRSEEADPQRVLVISSGWGLFGAVDRSSAFFHLVASVAGSSRRFGFDIRLKRRDEERLLPRRARQALDAAGVTLVPPDEPVPEVVGRYGLVVGDSSSALLESVVVGVPIVVLSYADLPQWDQPTLDTEIRRELSPLELEGGGRHEDVLVTATQPGYLEALRDRLFAAERHFFHALDGRCGRRAADVLLELLDPAS